MDGQIVIRVTVMRVTKFFLSTTELQIQFSNGLAYTRLFEMIIYWFFLKNVTFYFTKKLETRCK